VPGHAFGIGGDWYDVFTLPSGWVGVVIGDVSGHGLASAVIMGRIRSALRSYALICDNPAEALTLLDRKINHFEAGTFTTVLYAMISPGRDTALLSSAAHLPPVIAGADGPARLCDLPVDPPLGVGRLRSARRCTRVDLAPGDCLISYTDGLVERRGEVIDVGLDHLTTCITADAPERICTTLTSEFGADRPVDDVAILVLRRTAADTPE
jgi:phosphoserine phosphatase RsbU/P